MPAEAKVGAFEDEERAKRTVRWLRRSGLHPRLRHVDDSFEVVVPRGHEETAALGVLEAVEHTRERPELAKPTGWALVRSRLVNVEVLGVGLFAVFAAVLLLMAGIWVGGMIAMVGAVALGVVVVAGLVYFSFSGIPHSAVKEPRPYSHKHDITMGWEQEVQYRLAWARDQYRRSRRSRFRRKRRKS